MTVGQVAGERALGLQGSPNFRDAGGYAAAQGALHWGRLFRSGHLAYLTADDETRLAALGLELIVDLRRDDERELEPSKIPPGAALVGARITPGSQGSAIYADATQLGGADAMYDFMCEINREFVRSQSEAFSEVFAALLDSGAQRVLFHCSAGKDRTGFAIAMLQLALGVTEADVEADYALSRRYYLAPEQLPRVRQKYPVDHLSDDDLMPMMLADTAYLRAALDTIEKEWGDRERYLAEGLGLDAAARAELGRRFLDTGGQNAM